MLYKFHKAPFAVPGLVVAHEYKDTHRNTHTHTNTHTQRQRERERERDISLNYFSKTCQDIFGNRFAYTKQGTS
jgi:hypothetical protein